MTSSQSVYDEILVWWLAPEDFNFMSHDYYLPEWLRSQVQSALGRAGRGRLWLDTDRFPLDFGVSFGTSPLAGLCSNMAGIVLRRSDLKYLEYLPGIVTDHMLRRAF